MVVAVRRIRRPRSIGTTSGECTVLLMLRRKILTAIMQTEGIHGQEEQVVSAMLLAFASWIWAVLPGCEPADVNTRLPVVSYLRIDVRVGELRSLKVYAIQHPV